MGITVNDAATQTTLKYLGEIVSAIDDVLKERVRRKEKKDEYKLHKIDAKKQAQLYKEMTDNYTKMPQKITYPVNEIKLAEYVQSGLEDYNRIHKKQIPFEVHKNNRGRLEIITNEKALINVMT